MAPIASKDVVRFLEENPGFFLEEPELLLSSGLLEENGPSGKILNIRNRLFKQLKEEREGLLRLLEQAIETVQHNGAVERDFFAIEQILFQAPPRDDMLPRVAEELEVRFSLDHASFLLLEADGVEEIWKAAGPESGRVRLAGGALADAPLPAEPTLRGHTDEGAGILFPEECRGELRSTAVVPLRGGETEIGFLLLGSRDPERYSERMGTLLLQRLAVRLSLALTLLLRQVKHPSTGRGRRKKAPKAAAR